MSDLRYECLSLSRPASSISTMVFATSMLCCTFNSLGIWGTCAGSGRLKGSDGRMRSSQSLCRWFRRVGWGWRRSIRQEGGERRVSWVERPGTGRHRPMFLPRGPTHADSRWSPYAVELSKADVSDTPVWQLVGCFSPKQTPGI